MLAEVATNEIEECESTSKIHGDVEAGQHAERIKSDGQEFSGTFESSGFNTADSSVDDFQFRPDMPFKGANKIAFESYFMKKDITKKSPLKSCDLRKTINVKSNVSSKHRSRLKKQIVKKKATKQRSSKAKRKSSMNKKRRRRYKTKKKTGRRRKW